MKHRRIIFTYLLLNAFSAKVIAQKPAGTTIPVFFEKVYLHTDREIYAQGEDIWFKAYLVNAQNNRSINYSHNLYVELISPVAKIAQRRMLRLENGLGNGDFKLADTLAAGIYRLRAYTNWMRNFGDNFIFEKDIKIVDLLEKQTGIAQSTINKKQQPDKPIVLPVANADTIPIVQFFPESGAIINKVNTVIAIKAEDINGRGVTATGKVIDNAGKIINSFVCDSLGFGSFMLMPDITQHYQAVVTINGQQSRYSLPGVVADGFNLNVDTSMPDMLTVSINCNTETFNRYNGGHMPLIIKHGGKTYLRQVVLITDQHISVSIPVNDLPEGVASITITNELTSPVAERLIYIHHRGRAALVVTTDRTTYEPKEKVNVKLKLNTSEQASLSLAVVDAGAIPVQYENILSYLNLQSEIKGIIEHPDRYFDTTNVNRFKQLDLLLLTQGWRSFVWKRLEDTTLKFDYEAEQGLTITGKVRKVWTKGSLAGINITMRAPKAEGQKLFWATTDENGRFTIDNPVFYGYQLVDFNSRRIDKIKDDGSAKGFSGGWLQVDSLNQDTLPVLPVKKIRDTTNLKRQEALELERLRHSLRLPDSHNLKEVVIKANTSRLITRETPQVHTITRTEQKEYISLGQYLAYIIPEAGILQESTCPACYLGDGPSGRELIIPGIQRRPIPITGVYADHSYIDYCHICQENYMSLNMEDVLKVTINRYHDVFGLGVSVSIIMRPGVLETKDYFDNTVADMVGYYKAREFYKPKLEKPDDIDPRTNTIHWEPNITTNEKGEAMVSFYNTAQAGKMRLVAEGITPNGMPLTSTAVYEVK